MKSASFAMVRVVSADTPHVLCAEVTRGKRTEVPLWAGALSLRVSHNRDARSHAEALWRPSDAHAREVYGTRHERSTR
jgi:hypothetical protein